MSEELSEAKQQELSEKKQQELPLDPEADLANPEQVKRAIAEVIQSEFSGPIPPPNIIAGYENVVPGAADRIISMAETQARHRQTLETLEVKTEARDSLLGILFAFILGIGSITACIVIVIKVPQNAGAIAGSLLGVTGIGSIVSAFLKTTRGSYKKTNEDK